MTALIGANGCGKSTLLKTICRIIPAMDGDILLDGKNIKSYGSRELAKKIAILPQNPTAPGELTVRELVMYGRAPHQGSLFARTTKEGQIQYEGTSYEIFHNEMLRSVFGVDSTIMNDPKTNRPFCIPYSTKSYGNVVREV